MRIVALDGALARCSVAAWEDGRVPAAAAAEGPRGHAATLPALVREVLAASPGAPDAVAVTVGPGGFTGLRAAIALARGLALGWDVPCVGVTTGEALAADLPPQAGRAVWSAVDARRGRVALERPGSPAALFAAGALPLPPGPVLIVGDAAPAVAALLAARGADALAAPPQLPRAARVAAVAAARLRGALPPLAAEPLYLEPPATRAPAGDPVGSVAVGHVGG